jgi:hypothetical protein
VLQSRYDFPNRTPFRIEMTVSASSTGALVSFRVPPLLHRGLSPYGSAGRIVRWKRSTAWHFLAGNLGVRPNYIVHNVLTVWQVINPDRALRLGRNANPGPSDFVSAAGNL